MCNTELDSNIVNNNNTAYLDSGCTSHYLKNDAVCENIRVVTDNVEVVLPNGANIVSNTMANLNIEGLTDEGTEARLFENIRVNLISLGQLCDDDCIITLSKKKAQVRKHNKLIMEAQRNLQNGMWIFDMSRKQTRRQESINNVYEIT